MKCYKATWFTYVIAFAPLVMGKIERFLNEDRKETKKGPKERRKWDWKMINKL